MGKWTLVIWWMAAYVSLTMCECPNACSGHGGCGYHDQCSCWKNWFGGDCSLRQCQFGLAHIDTPKGDLDADGEISDMDTHIIYSSQTWPLGTTEQYPAMYDSDFNRLSNSAHEYAECSNKGFCDRVSGSCWCVPGYSGSACHRADCPVVSSVICNGHGTCKSARELAIDDHENMYELWDADVTMGCDCDSGYYGAACEHKMCKLGYDPIYDDLESSVRYSNWSIAIVLQSSTDIIAGNYSIVFFDATGEDWKTEPISYGASCLTVIDALENLPNSVIPYGSVKCNMWEDYHHIPYTDEPVKLVDWYNPFYGIKYQLAFPANPGILRAPELDIHLDGSRPTLFSTETSGNQNTLQYFVYPNGFQGEVSQYFDEKCIGVDLTLLTQPVQEIAGGFTSEYTYLGGLSSLETRLLQRCLGESDLSPSIYSATGSIEGQTYTWDYGDVYYPHIVRLVDRTDPHEIISDLCNRTADESTDAWVDSSVATLDGGRSSLKGRRCSPGVAPPGFLAALYFDDSLGRYVLMTRPSKDYSTSTTFAIWTTTGSAQMVSDEAMIYTSPNFEDVYSSTIYSTNASSTYADYQGNIECEVNPENRNGAVACIEKEDLVFFLDKDRQENNPEYLNIYTVKRLQVEPQSPLRSIQDSYREGSTRNRITVDAGIASRFDRSNGTYTGRAYKFRPPKGHVYVSECSNRGLCETSTGVCECFNTFSGDDCSTLNVMSKLIE